MTIVSLEFLLFFFAILLIYYTIGYKIQPYVLFVGSILFYYLATSNFTFIYLIISIISVYIATLYFEKNKGEEKQNYRRLILVITILINVFMLGLLKYVNFFINTINMVLSGKVQLDLVNLTASLGISFYTLQIIGYLLDCYWGVIQPQKNIVKFSLFSCYFPQMVSGPISRYSQIGDNLCNGNHKFSYEQFTFGMQRIGWGFFQKLFISERIAVIANTIYGDLDTYKGIYIWIGTLFFVLQLYTDFNGYMDIVLGVSECFGIKLPENFRTPFFSRTIQEFWQRWHITLGTWLKDYIMYPVLKSKLWDSMRETLKKKFGKKTGKKIPVYIGMLILWLAMGLWHGNSWKYVVGEGVWFWLVIVGSQLAEPLVKTIIKKTNMKTECFSFHLFQSLRTWIVFCTGMVFFRAVSFKQGLRIIKSAILDFRLSGLIDGSFDKLGLDKNEWFLVWFGLIILLIVSTIRQKTNDVRLVIKEQNVWFRWTVWIFIVISVVIYGVYGGTYDASNFIYQQF